MRLYQIQEVNNLEFKKTFYGIKQLADNSLDIFIYDEIKGDSVDWLWGDVIESETSANHIKKVLESNPNATQINVYVNSCGGDVQEAIAIKNQILRHPAHTTAYIDSFCCSAAVDIALSCDEVIMYTGSVMMMHHASMCVYGNPAQLRKMADDLEVIDKASCSTYTRGGKIKISQEELDSIIDGADGTGSWLSAEDCLEKGFCDKIADLQKDTLEDIKQKFNLSIQQHLNIVAQHNQINIAQRINKSTQTIINPIGDELNLIQEMEPQEPTKLNNFQKFKQSFMKEGSK